MSMSKPPLKVLAVVGSLKKDSVTRVVIQHVAEKLAQRDPVGIFGGVFLNKQAVSGAERQQAEQALPR